MSIQHQHKTRIPTYMYSHLSNKRGRGNKRGDRGGFVQLYIGRGASFSAFTC